MSKLSSRKRYSRIAGLSDRRMLPRLDHIRLGIMVPHPNVERGIPKEVHYFVCPKCTEENPCDVRKVYGEEPTELDVLVPVEDESVVFPHALKWYRSRSLACSGDGETAMRVVRDLVVTAAGKKGQLPKGAILDDAHERIIEAKADLSDEFGLVEIGCANSGCPLTDIDGYCGQKASLMLFLPKVSMGGVYQIATGSVNNIVRLNSAFDLIRATVGRISMVPLKLSRMPEQTEHRGERSTHYLLQLHIDANLHEVLQMQAGNQAVLMRAAKLMLPETTEEGPVSLGVDLEEAEEVEGGATGMPPAGSEPSGEGSAAETGAPPTDSEEKEEASSTLDDESTSGPEGGLDEAIMRNARLADFGRGEEEFELPWDLATALNKQPGIYRLSDFDTKGKQQLAQGFLLILQKRERADKKARRKGGKK